MEVAGKRVVWVSLFSILPLCLGPRKGVDDNVRAKKSVFICLQLHLDKAKLIVIKLKFVLSG